MTKYIKNIFVTLGEGLGSLAEYFSLNNPFYLERNFDQGFQEDKVIENDLEKSIGKETLITKLFL